jgi:hypothetical protein
MEAQMSPQPYKGYAVWGFAKANDDGTYEATGSVSNGKTLLEGSDSLGNRDTFEAAVEAGLAWAKAWVDDHG